MIAKISMWRDIVQILIQKYSRLIETGRINKKQSAAAKYFSTEVLAQAADQAVQIHGANGLREDDYGISAVYRYVRSLKIRDGTSEILLERIAQEEGL